LLCLLLVFSQGRYALRQSLHGAVLSQCHCAAHRFAAFMASSTGAVSVCAFSEHGARAPLNSSRSERHHILDVCCGVCLLQHFIHDSGQVCNRFFHVVAFQLKKAYSVDYVINGDAKMRLERLWL
jgi:hypothetical protein